MLDVKGECVSVFFCFLNPYSSDCILCTGCVVFCIFFFVIVFVLNNFDHFTYFCYSKISVCVCGGVFVEDNTFFVCDGFPFG